MTIAMALYQIASHYVQRSAERSASTGPVGQEQATSRLFSSVGEDLEEPVRTLPSRLPARLQQLADRLMADEKEMAESVQKLNSLRSNETLIRA